MPIRKIPIATSEIYHVYNRSVAQVPIFKNSREYSRFLSLVDFYRFNQTQLRFSHFSRLTQKQKYSYLDSLYASPNHVEIYALAIMPNHYHFLVKQTKDLGITNFIRLIQNSYAKYINTKLKRVGSLFQSPFKAVRIETEEQFLHVSRYIHLNPLTSYVIRNSKDLSNYPWNSYKDYVSNTSRIFINIEPIKALIKSKEAFVKFTLDQLEYQRELENIKHLTFDNDSYSDVSI